jgi:hypothetical protein
LTYNANPDIKFSALVFSVFTSLPSFDNEILLTFHKNIFSRNHELLQLPKQKRSQKIPKIQKKQRIPKNPIPRENPEFGIGFFGFFFVFLGSSAPPIISDLVVKFNQVIKTVPFEDKKIEYENGL